MRTRLDYLSVFRLSISFVYLCVSRLSIFRVSLPFLRLAITSVSFLSVLSVCLVCLSHFCRLLHLPVGIVYIVPILVLLALHRCPL